MSAAETKSTNEATRWVICAVALTAFALIPVLEEVRRVEVGYAVATGLLMVMLAALYRDGRAKA